MFHDALKFLETVHPFFAGQKKDVWVCDQEKIFIISRNVPWKKNQFSCTNGKKEIESIIEDDNQRQAQGCESKPTSSLILKPCKKVLRVLRLHIRVIFAFLKVLFCNLFQNWISIRPLLKMKGTFYLETNLSFMFCNFQVCLKSWIVKGMMIEKWGV